MTSSFAVENRDALRQRYFEAKDRGDAAAVTHAQALLGDSLFSPQHRSSGERVSLIGINSLEVVPKQLSAQARDIRPTLLSGKMIADLTQGKSLSSTEISTLDKSLATAITNNRKYVWYRLGNASVYESTILEFCDSFFTSRPNKEERPTHSFLILRIIDLTFCRKDVQPTPEFTEGICYLVMCKVQDFVDIQFSKMEEELEEVAVGQREFREEFLQTIHKIRKTVISLWGKLSAAETKPLLCAEEMRFVKQALNLYETEISYAAALDKVAGKEDYAEELRCMLALGKLYAKKRERQALIQSAGMFNYAWRLIEDPQYLPTMQMDVRHARRTEILHALGQVEVQLFRLIGIKTVSPQGVIERARASILANRKNLQEKRKIIDEEIEKLEEESTPQQIARAHRLITYSMKIFTTQLIKQCMIILGKAPCHYAVIGLGSMAREEMTHYSDLEFAILIKEGAEQHKEYFRNLTYLLHLKVINLGETILPALNIPCLNSEGGIGFFDGVTPRGFAFDGAGVKGKGCKTPLGNGDNVSEKGRVFELIQTPSKMAQYIGIDRESIDWPKVEPHLPMEMLNCTLITGKKKLLRTYRSHVRKELALSYREQLSVREYLAKEHLRAEDERSFDPAWGSLEREGQLIKAKQDLYRLPHLAIQRLSLLMQIKLPNTLGCIQKLYVQGKIIQEGKERLTWLLSYIMMQRLKVYSYSKQQKELMNPLLAAKLPDLTTRQKEFILDEKSLSTLTAMYQILTLLQKAIQEFFCGNDTLLKTETFQKSNLYTLGLIKLRLFQHEEAEKYFLLLIQNFPNDFNLLLLLGTIYQTLGKYQEALDYFKTALALQIALPSETTAQILVNIGVTLNALGRHKEAFTHYEKAQAIYQEFNTFQLEEAFCWSNIGKNLCDQGEYQHALNYFERALEKYCSYKSTFDEASCLEDIGHYYHIQGDYLRALKYKEKALVLRKQLFGEFHPKVAMSLNNIGATLDCLGRHQEAMKNRKAALEMHRQFNSPYIASSLNNLGDSLSTLGKHQEALLQHEQALEIHKRNFKSPHPELASILNDIGKSLAALGKPKEALVHHYEAIKVARSVFGESHPDLAVYLNELGERLNLLGRHQEALDAQKRALTMIKKVFGEVHPNVMSYLSNLGNSLCSLGDYQSALTYFEEALKISQKCFDDTHPIVATNQQNLGNILHCLGRDKEALTYFENALAISEALLSDSHPMVANIWNNMANSLASLGLYKEALRYQRQALASHRKTFGPSHPLIASTLDNLGNRHSLLGQHQTGLEYHQQALEMNRNIFGSKHPAIADGLINVGNSLCNLGKYREALVTQEEALKMYQLLFDEAHPKIADSLCSLAASLDLLDDYPNALARLKEALKIYKNLSDKPSLGVAAILDNMGNTLLHLGSSEAFQRYQEALEIRQKWLGPSHPLIARSLNNIGNSLFHLGNYQEALKKHQVALMMRLEFLGESHPDIAASCNNIALALSELGKYTKALQYSKKALEIYQKLPDISPLRMAEAWHGMGASLCYLGNDKKALEFFEKALGVRRTHLDRFHIDIANTLTNIGTCLNGIGQRERALNTHEESLAIYRKLFGNTHPHIAVNLNNIGTLLADLNKHKEALEKFREAFEMSCEIHKKEHPTIITCLKGIVNSLISLNDRTLINKYSKTLFPFCVKILGKGHDFTQLFFILGRNHF